MRSITLFISLLLPKWKIPIVKRLHSGHVLIGVGNWQVHRFKPGGRTFWVNGDEGTDAERISEDDYDKETDQPNVNPAPRSIWILRVHASTMTQRCRIAMCADSNFLRVDVFLHYDSFVNKSL